MDNCNIIWMFSKLAASEVSKCLNMDRTEAWIKPSLGRPEPRSPPRCYCCTFLSTSSVERRPSAARHARCFYNHVWKLHPWQFRNPMKTPCFWSALSVPLSGGAVWLTVDSPYLSHSWRRLVWEQGTLSWRPGLVLWSALFFCSAHHLCRPLSVWASTSFIYTVFSVTTEVKKNEGMKRM